MMYSDDAFFPPPLERNQIESHMVASAQDNNDISSDSDDNSDGDGKCTFDNTSSTISMSISTKAQHQQ